MTAIISIFMAASPVCQAMEGISASGVPAYAGVSKQINFDWHAKKGSPQQVNRAAIDGKKALKVPTAKQKAIWVCSPAGAGMKSRCTTAQ